MSEFSDIEDSELSSGQFVAGDEQFRPQVTVIAFGHPRGAIRPIPRYPRSTADLEYDAVLFSKKPISDNSGLNYPVAQGGMPPIGT